SRRLHTICYRHWSSDVCSSDLIEWSQLSPRLPSFISVVRDVAFDNAGNIWVASREGLWVTKNGGESWDHSMDGVPAMEIFSIHKIGRASCRERVEERVGEELVK